MLAEAAARFPTIVDTFAESSEALGYDLWKLVQSGPEDKLTLTEFTQPAILTASVALYRCWLAEGGAVPAFVAGHSLGEYSALVAAQSLTLSDAARLVQIRGRAMQSAVPPGEGAMCAVLGLDDVVIDTACRELATVEAYVGAVNYNSPGQVVIAGHRGAVLKAAEALRDLGAKKVMDLPVSAPFHTPLMGPAAEAMAEALAATSMNDAHMPVISNVDARPHSSKDEIQGLLVQQICAPVLWTQCVARLVEAGASQFIECGPGKVLCGLLKRIDRALESNSLEDPEALLAALAS